jgi:hypothetical protein
MEPLEKTSETQDAVRQWLKESVSPAIEEASLYLYEFSRSDLRDIDACREMLSKISTLNHKLGIIYADVVELRNEFQTQCDEVYSRVVLTFGGRNPNTDTKLTQESIKAAGDLASSDIRSFAELFPTVAKRLNMEPGSEPKRRHNSLSATAEKIKGIQRDLQESVNAIKHIGNRELQHVIHGIS